MNLENLENKEPIIKDFFEWLFDDNRIINKNVNLEKEIDFVLAPNYLDANIYYPKQIADFFNAKAMKRLERISQLDLVIDKFPNAYHNRLDHSKGVYYRKLEEMLYNFQNADWKTNIENNGYRLYLLADLIKMAGHDIGHLPLSHALEMQIFSRHDVHEIIGKRIMLENAEIQSILTDISPDLPNALRDLYEIHILNFQEHDESSYDVDRLDYISRDTLYTYNPVFIPYSHYKTIPVRIDELGNLQINNDGSILTCDTSPFTIDVYDYNSLRNIENFLETRECGYINIYRSTDTHVRENCIGALFKSFLTSNSKAGIALKHFVTNLRGINLDNIDLSSFLEWDDLKFYSEILDIAENHEDYNIRLLATMTVPNLKAFLTMLYSHLKIYVNGQVYSEQDKQFLTKIKNLIKGQDLLSKNLRNSNFAKDNTLVFSKDKPLPEAYNNLIKRGLINSSLSKIKAYDIDKPIYIKGANGKIYELSQHPDRKCDWNSRITLINNVYTYVPLLRLNGVSENEIEKMRKFSDNDLSQENISETMFRINMQPLQVGHNIEDKFLEI